ncbi:beta-lactamase superfamily II metal-dependent hydrolase [Cytobacillus oceanisediminis]|uniref:Beta-lactamase superfamily II metal-dependent hydrolase n=1 Tax=Cytobacillus oceanisediminis TaxID=665099 RepID=A0A2V3A114_9BACI|nr:S-layer homology domain-containing protein [Cytobacillus oceanisediminis]PWW29392.1 beta-lactamase superfamily II metal-dependent hydrolase [Cytobacillus oceanisediminis]
MKKLVVLFLTVSLFLIPISKVSASPGGTDSSGGHTCWTNCAQYGLETGEYHYHDANGNIIRDNPKPQPGLFTDTGGHWAEANINLLYELGLVGGYSDGSFGVKKSITRAEVAVIITRHLDLPTARPSFTDVTSKHWAYTSIGAVAKADIMGGYSGGSFKPNAAITRAELAAMLVRAYDLTGKSSISFKDVSTKHWAYGVIQVLVHNDITGGYPDNTFRPNSNVNRAEFASFLARIIRNYDVNIAGGEITAHFINVGQGDSILLETPNGKNVLIDGGNRYAGDEVIDYLAKEGINSIDVMVATHPDADHIGGLIEVLKKVPVKKVLDSGKVHTTQTYTDYLTLIDQKDIPMEIPSKGEFLNIDEDLVVQVLNSTYSSSDLNESSVVLKVVHEDVSFLLTGDATMENEANMTLQYNVSADILKAGHHGSSTSTSSSFLNKVQPSITILSYGDNSYGHPNSEVVLRLKSIGSKIFSTYNDGNIIVESTENGFTVEEG